MKLNKPLFHTFLTSLSLTFLVCSTSFGAAARENLEERYQNISAGLVAAHKGDNNKTHVANSFERISNFAAGLKQGVIVLGAGACHDVPISFLVKNFAQISLVEIDIETSKKAIDALVDAKEITVDEQEKISFHRIDLSGIEQFIKGGALQEKFESLPDFADALSFIQSLNPAHLIAEPILPGADYVVSSLITTQVALAMMQEIQALFTAKYGPDHKYELESACQVLDDKIKKGYMKLLPSLLDSPQGRIYYAHTPYEYIKASHSYGAYLDVDLVRDFHDPAKINKFFKMKSSKRAAWKYFPGNKPAGNFTLVDSFVLEKDL